MDGAVSGVAGAGVAGAGAGVLGSDVVAAGGVAGAVAGVFDPIIKKASARTTTIPAMTMVKVRLFMNVSSKSPMCR